MKAHGKDNEAPEYAEETRVVDFGQNPPEEAMLDKLPAGTPIPDAIKVQFVTMRGPGAQRATEMRKPIVILGRVDGVADVLVEDEAASRYHACVTHRDGSFTLTDMGSTNGTFVNRRRVATVELKSRDQIRIGVTVLEFEILPRR